MTSTERSLLVALVLAVVGVEAYRVGRARADGVPSTSPMYYSGTMEEAGVPVDGTRDIVLTLWDDATLTGSAHARCVTTASATPVAAGRFRVALSDACTAVVHATPDLWIEPTVAGASLGRSKLGAVPFALEAGRAADLVPALRSALTPTGSVVAFAGTAAPAGWLLCDGSAQSRATHAALFAVVGTTYGAGDGASTFNLPDLRGRVAVGADRTGLRVAGNNALGQSGGEATHTLSAAETPLRDHQHDMRSANMGGAPPQITATGDVWGGAAGGGTVTGILTTAGLSYWWSFGVAGVTGGAQAGAPHNNMQPYQVVNFIIKD